MSPSAALTRAATLLVAALGVSVTLLASGPAQAAVSTDTYPPPIGTIVNPPGTTPVPPSSDGSSSTSATGTGSVHHRASQAAGQADAAAPSRSSSPLDAILPSTGAPRLILLLDGLLLVAIGAVLVRSSRAARRR